MMVESIIIDSDHWPHVFLLLGGLWGLIAATRAYVSSAPARWSAADSLAFEDRPTALAR